MNNDVFAENSWYFRNALVRANYNDLQNGVHATNEFWEQFFENLLLGAKHELKNRCLHVDYEKPEEVQSATGEAPKCNNCTLVELAILRAIAANEVVAGCCAIR